MHMCVHASTAAIARPCLQVIDTLSMLQCVRAANATSGGSGGIGAQGHPLVAQAGASTAAIICAPNGNTTNATVASVVEELGSGLSQAVVATDEAPCETMSAGSGGARGPKCALSEEQVRNVGASQVCLELVVSVSCWRRIRSRQLLLNGPHFGRRGTGKPP